jgi:hypothetical protein
MDGEAYSEASTKHPDEGIGEHGEDHAGSGWTTTKQAAKVLGVSRRSVQGYVRRGILEAQEEGKGVSKRFFVSIDSLNALSERRRREAGEAAKFAEASAKAERAANLAANAGETLRHVIDRLEARTVEAAELRIRLELTEKAQSSLEEALAEERRRREEAEREREDLRRELDALSEARAPESPDLIEEAPTTGYAHEDTVRPEGHESARSLWSRLFGR